MRKSASLAILCTVALLVLPPPALAQVGVVARVSTALDGTAGSGASTVHAISADGCVVAFSSFSTDLILNDTNSNEDVFAFDCDSMSNLRVSLRNGGSEAHGNSSDASIMGASVRSGAIASLANDIVANDLNGAKDIFVVAGDVENGMPTVIRVSVPNLADQGMLGTEANASSDNPSYGGNERFVAFDSEATNLVFGDTLGFTDVFVHDRQTSATARVSVPNLADQGMLGTQANGGSFTPVISGNGRFVAFESSASNLVMGDTNNSTDVFVHDRLNIAQARVNVPNLADQGMLGTQTGASVSFLAAISADGRFVAFESNASNLVLNDTNGNLDIFVHDRQTGATIRVDVVGATEANDGAEGEPVISADGRFVAFDSRATNLAVNDDNGTIGDAFLAQTAFSAEPLPFINNGGVVSAASFAPGGAVAPGSIVGVFGLNLAEGLGIAGATPLPTVLAEGGAVVEFNNGATRINLPLFFVSPGQMNAQVPFEAPTGGTVNIFPVELGTSGTDSFFDVVQFAPGIFTTNQQGTGQAAILIANTAMLAAPMGAFPGSRPAKRGEDFLEVYWTGGGPVNPPVPTGTAASANPLSATTTTPTVSIGGINAPVLFSGLAPGFVGLNVLTCLVPAMAPIGDAVDVVVTQGMVTSNTVTIAIDAAP